MSLIKLKQLENKFNILEERLDVLEKEVAKPPLEFLEDRSTWKDKMTSWDQGKEFTSSTLSSLRPCYCYLPPSFINITIPWRFVDQASVSEHQGTPRTPHTNEMHVPGTEWHSGLANQRQHLQIYFTSLITLLSGINDFFSELSFMSQCVPQRFTKRILS